MNRPAAARHAMDRRQVAWAAAAMVFGGAPHLFMVTPWVPLLVLAIALWRILAAARGWRLPSLWIRVPVTVLAFLGVALTYRGVAGVDAGSALLLVMAGMKLLETRTERDRIVVVLIGYFLLFAVLLREQAIWSFAWLVVGTIGITAALAQTVRHERLLPVPAAAVLAARLLLQALPLAALLFVLFPRIPGPFWAMPETRSAGISGLDDQIEPGDIAELSLSDAVAFRVRFEGAVPPAEALYWRGPVLERFDGRRWLALPDATRESAPDRTRVPGPIYGYQLVLEPQGQRWLLALETPLAWSVPHAALGRSLQLQSAEPFAERLSYRARSASGGVTRVEPPPEVLAYNLRLPAGRNPRTLELAAKLRSDSTAARTYLARVLQFLGSGTFSYSLTPPPLGVHSVDDLLFGSRQGFCEHYASAFAVLARAGGIPARVVVGYQGGERNPFGDYWIVRQANAHAWVEAWFDGAWRRIDPTSVVAPGRIASGIEATLAATPVAAERLWRANAFINRMVLSWDAVNAVWDRWVLAFGPEMQADLLLALGFEVPRVTQLTGLAIAGTIACMLVMGLLLRQAPRRRRDVVALAYASLCGKLAGIVRARLPAETASHYAAAIASARPDLAGEVDALTALYLELRYGAPADPARAHELATRVRRFRPRAAPARR